MGIIDQESNNHTWENLNNLKSVFSKKVYSILSRLKEKKDREGFSDTLEVVVDMDKTLLKKLKASQFPLSTDEMSINEINKALTISPYENFIDKIKYKERALYLIKNYKEEDQQYALLLNNLAELYRLMGKYKKAEPLYKKSLALREKLLGEEHPDTASSYNNLAVFYLSQGEFSKAEPLYFKALKIKEKVLGEEDPDTASSYNNLAVFYLSQAEYSKAEPLYFKALKIREKILGEEHPDTASSYANLANFYYSQGKYSEVEPLTLKALKIREKVLDEEHPDTADSYNNLARLYYLQGEYSKAEPLILKALKIREKILGEERLDTAASYNNLASLYQLQGEYSKAEPLTIKALKIKEKVLGKEHPDTASSYANLANLYTSQGEYSKAEALYLKALKIREKVLGEEHPNTATSYDDLAIFYHLQDEYSKAEPLYIKALKIYEKVLGGEHSNTVNAYNNYNLLITNRDKLFFINSKFSNLTFKIDKVKVENFKQYKSPFEISFSKKINIIIGQNATGKTTLLQAITLGVLKDNFLDARKLDYDKYITKDQSEAKIIIVHNNKEKIVKIKQDEIEIENPYFSPFVLAYGSNFFTKYKLSADEVVKDILDETIHKGTVTSIFRDYTDEFWNPLTILNELDRSEHKKAKEKSKLFFEAINHFLEGYKLFKKDKRYFFRKNKETTVLALEELSEGYRSNVLLITDMLVKILGVGWTPKTIEGMILIDEFDKHLHPRWQSRLINQLTKTFPNIQFIMTTHNPMSVLDREPDEITILKEIDGEIVAVRGKGTKTIDVSTVLLEYFGVKSTVSDSMQEKISRFNTLKVQKERSSTEEAELKELETFLGNTVASNFIYNRPYLQFLTYLKDHQEINFDQYEQLDESKREALLEEFGDLFDD